MGIPSYFSYIVKNHIEIIKKLNSNTMQVNNLYLDCNSIIYDAVHNIDFTKLTESDIDTIIRVVCEKINEFIILLKPDNNLLIAFDGVAPVAKLDQQRSRRYKSLYQNIISKPIFKNSKPTNNSDYKSYIERIITHIKNNKAIINGDKLIKNLKDINPPNTFNHGDFSIYNIIEQNNKLFLIDPIYSNDLFQSYYLDIAKHLFSILFYSFL
jgi:5'-3' exonuclease